MKLKPIFLSQFRDFVFSILSAVILLFAYPKTDLWFLAWFGLIPLMAAIDRKSYRQAFWLSYLSGFIFFSCNLYWFIHVTKVGAFLMMLVLAVYYGLFGLVYRYFQDRSAAVKLILLPSGWVVIEFFRSRLFSGFDWVSLGHSQYKFLPVIQIADLAGVFGVSFFLVMINLFLKFFMEKKVTRKVWMIFLPVCAVVFIYGNVRLREEHSREELKVAVVQGNIEQSLKWEEELWPVIMSKHKGLTKLAAAQNPDLIIWPETSFPGFLWEHQEQYEQLQDFVRALNIPLLFGSIVIENKDYFNDAILLSSRGEELNHYHKLHLVPFGEYIPFRRYFPFISEFVPIADFTPGKDQTVFDLNLAQSSLKFAVLICFEDTVARLTRKFVKNKAELLINITNDAWFKDTKAPFLHLQAAVFRTVENRRWLIRAANTGVSCFINEKGKIIKYLSNDQGKKTFVPGHQLAEVKLLTHNTFYTLYGDFFAYLCFTCIVGGMVSPRIRKMKILNN